MPTPHTYFEKQIKAYQQQEAAYQARYNKLAIWRLMLFLGGLAGLIYGLNVGYYLYAALFGMFALVLFMLALKKHKRLAYQRDHYRLLKTINAEELKRLSGQIKDFDQGMAYAEPLHPYTADLDIFGPYSLFQFLNRTATQQGEQKLADWLRHYATAPEVRSRQQAVAELATQPDWLQNFHALGKHGQAGKQDVQALQNWLSAPYIFRGRIGLIALSYIMPVVTIILLVLSLSIIPYQIALLSALANMAVLGITHKATKVAASQINQTAAALQAHAAMLEAIEKAEYAAPKLVALRQQLLTQTLPASVQIKRLSVMLENLEARNNPYFALIAEPVLLWSNFWMLRLENWKKDSGQHIQTWLDALGEIEALASLAATYFANPDWCMPTISDAVMELQADQMGHWMIPAHKRVTNSLSVSGTGQAMIITGANMSGKSTFLRTVGVNIVLALMGSAVCARGFRVSPIQLFTGMRSQDSLEENISSFYAELRRIRQLIDMLKENPPVPVLYFLDEILKGTNSRDRHLGAVALVRQLLKANASGFVSTHDLELGSLAHEQPGHITNYSFNSSIVNDEIVFDYKISAGVCNSFNAAKMMEKMGIDIHIEQHPKP